MTMIRNLQALGVTMLVIYVLGIMALASIENSRFFEVVDAIRRGLNNDIMFYGGWGVPFVAIGMTVFSWREQGKHAGYFTGGLFALVYARMWYVFAPYYQAQMEVHGDIPFATFAAVYMNFVAPLVGITIVVWMITATVVNYWQPITGAIKKVVSVIRNTPLAQQASPQPASGSRGADQRAEGTTHEYRPPNDEAEFNEGANDAPNQPHRSWNEQPAAAQEPIDPKEEKRRKNLWALARDPNAPEPERQAAMKAIEKRGKRR